jgi:hypothetical protein
MMDMDQRRKSAELERHTRVKRSRGRWCCALVDERLTRVKARHVKEGIV